MDGRTSAKPDSIRIDSVRTEGSSRLHIGNNYYLSEESCLRHLRLTDPRGDKKRIEQTKGGLLRDSYRWILDNADFRRWRDDPQHRLLWIKGDAGKGKTMLLCGIINELESAANAGQVSYFFCQGTDAQLNNATAILRGLIYLLVVRQPCLISHLQTEYDRAGKRFFEDANAFYALCGVFHAILRDSRLAAAYLVIDALDECEENLQQLLEIIRDTASAASVPIKWIVSSRNRPDIEQQFTLDDSRMRLSLELNAEQVSLAIDLYIDHKVSRLQSIEHDTAVQRQVRAQMRQKANGTFLWVALAFQELQKPMPTRDVLPLLEKFPPGLVPLYDRMMNQVEQYAGSCRHVLAMVTFAHRPLYISELQILAEVSDVRELEKIIHLCGSFITIRDAQVYLIHQSAKDYLTTSALPKVFPSGSHAIHHDLFLRSLRALSRALKRDIYGLRDPGLLVDEVQPPNPDPLCAVRYSCVYWADHLLEAHEQNPDPEKELPENEEIYTFLKAHFTHWLEALSLLRKVPDGILSIRRLLHAVQPISSVGGISEKASIRKSFRTLRLIPDIHAPNVSTVNKGFQLVDFLKDAVNFALNYGSIIEEAPLQTYASALLFCPTNSKVKGQYWKERLPLIRDVTGINEHWGPCLQTLEGHSDSVWSVAYSPDGRTLASASNDRTIRLWDTAAGRTLQTLEGHSDSVQSVAYSPDGRTLASASDDGTVRLWDTATGRTLQTLEERHSSWVRSVAYSPDGRTLASASNDRTIRLWDTATGRTLQTLERHSGSVGSVAYSPDGRTLASASNDRTVRLWDTATGRTLQTLEDGHSDWVGSVAYSPDGRTLASASNDRTIRLRDTATGRTLQTLEGRHSDWVRSVAFSPDGRTLASASNDRTVRLWDTAAGRTLQTLEGHSSWVLSVAYSPDGRTLASASDDGTVRLWDTATGRTLQTLEDGHSDSVGSVAYSPDGRTLASALNDRTIRLWDTATGRTLQTLEGRHSDWVRSVAFSPDGRTLASASDDGTVRLWDTATGRMLQTLEGHIDWVGSVAFSPDSRTLASASSDRTIWLWDAATGRTLEILEGHSDWIWSVAYSPNGRTLASASEDRTIRLWDTATGRILQTLEGHSDSVGSVAYSPDGRTLASASNDNTIRLWDTATGCTIQTLNVGQAAKNLRWENDSSGRLHTNFGTFKVRPTVPSTDITASPVDHSRSLLQPVKYGLDSNSTWITYNCRNILWLPSEYRPSSSAISGTAVAISGTAVAIVCRSGRVVLLRFSGDNPVPFQGLDSLSAGIF